MSHSPKITFMASFNMIYINRRISMSRFSLFFDAHKGEHPIHKPDPRRRIPVVSLEKCLLETNHPPYKHKTQNMKISGFDTRTWRYMSMH